MDISVYKFVNDRTQFITWVHSILADGGYFITDCASLKMATDSVESILDTEIANINIKHTYEQEFLYKFSNVYFCVGNYIVLVDYYRPVEYWICVKNNIQLSNDNHTPIIPVGQTTFNIFKHGVDEELARSEHASVEHASVEHLRSYIQSIQSIYTYIEKILKAKQQIHKTNNNRICVFLYGSAIVRCARIKTDLERRLTKASDHLSPSPHIPQNDPDDQSPHPHTFFEMTQMLRPMTQMPYSMNQMLRLMSKSVVG